MQEGFSQLNSIYCDKNTYIHYTATESLIGLKFWTQTVGLFVTSAEQNSETQAHTDFNFWVSIVSIETEPMRQLVTSIFVNKNKSRDCDNACEG